MRKSRLTKIAVFVEGPTETKFASALVGRRYQQIRFKISKVSLRGRDSFIKVRQTQDIPGLDCWLLIIEVPSYEKVASYIKDNAGNMVNKHSFDLLLGLRDLSPDKRRDKARVIDSIHKVFMGSPEERNITIILAVMETEAWFLCDWRLFERIDTRLTARYIESRLGLDLVNKDPELEYEKPSKTIDDILRLVGLRYRKHAPEVDTVVRNIDLEYLFSCDAKIDSFFRFLEALDRCIARS